MSDLDELEAALFDARETLVGHAEARGYGHLFSDRQSIGDMREQILAIDDSTARDVLFEKFVDVERLYEEYTAALVGDVVSS